MFNLRSITVDVPSKKAWVQSGATLGELYTKISDASKTLAFPAGVCSTVGTGGHISGGGYGNLMRKYGITVDHVVDALLVDVNGKLLNRSTMGEDLFWAIRGGGGGSFGVILSWKINLVNVPKILTVFKVNKTLEQGGTDVLYKWQFVSSKLPESLFIRAMPQVVNKTVAVLFYAQFLGRANELVSIMNQSLPELGLKRQDCQEMSWLNTTLFWEDLPVGTPRSILLDRPSKPEKFFKSKSDYVKKPIPKKGIKKLWNVMLKFKNNVYMQWNPYGGVMDKIPSTATPFPHRKGNLFKIQYYTSWLDANTTSGSLNMMKKLYKVAEPYVSSNPREAFLNYRDIDIGSNPSGQTNVDEAEIYGSKYFLGNLRRLMEVKAKYDPENFFKNEQSIPPARVKEALVDPLLSRYSVIIVDEAHERTVHTDVLLALLKKVQLDRSKAVNERSDEIGGVSRGCQGRKASPLKLIIMSASLDARVFSEYYGGAKVLHVQGRQFPVDILYTVHPETDYVDAALVTIFQIESVERLVEERLQHLPEDKRKLLPLAIFSALPSEQQMRVFAPAPNGFRKVVLATNIAETSITIPEIRYVVDTGVVKARTYDPSKGMESLDVVPTSKAQALQRSGRAGREGPGKCYRLYPQREFEKLEDSTKPEIKRCNLSNVILQLKALGIDDIDGFDFIDKPSR
ncbi:hypothetical protein Bca4012_055015 [Brassica carinata]